jgi:septal ring factor EnvC (AmiA/AmiB activator)
MKGQSFLYVAVDNTMFCTQYSLNTLKAFAEHLSLKELSRHKKADLCAVLEEHFGNNATKIKAAISKYNAELTQQWETVEAALDKAQTLRHSLLHKARPRSYSEQQELVETISEQEGLIASLEKQSRQMVKIVMNLEERDGSMPVEMAEVMADHRDESKQALVESVQYLERKISHLEVASVQLQREKQQLYTTVIKQNVEIDDLRRQLNARATLQGGYEKRSIARKL